MVVKEDDYRLRQRLVLEWSSALKKHQLNLPETPALDGGISCDACQRIHGRCTDALLAFLYAAKKNA